MVSVTNGHYCVNTVTILNTNLSAGQVMDPMRETLSCRWLVGMEPVQMGWGAWHQATGGELCRLGGTEWQSALSTPCQIGLTRQVFLQFGNSQHKHPAVPCAKCQCKNQRIDRCVQNRQRSISLVCWLMSTRMVLLLKIKILCLYEDRDKITSHIKKLWDEINNLRGHLSTIFYDRSQIIGTVPRLINNFGPVPDQRL